MSNKGRKMATISVLSISLSAPAALVPVLANLGEAYPVAGSWLQLLITIPSLFMMLSSLFTDWLSRFFSMRGIAGASILLILLSGVSPYFFGTFSFLLFTRAVMGIGIGLLNTTVASLPALYFGSGKTRDTATGVQAAFISGGGILFNLLSGGLAMRHWKLVYLAQLINILPLLVVLFLMPSSKNTRNQAKSKEQCAKKSGRLTKEAVLIALLSFVIITMTVTFPLNISVFVSKRSLGTAQFVGVLASINSLIGFIVGLLFAKILGKVKNYTLPIGLIITSLGFIAITFAPRPWALVLGSGVLGVGTSLISPALYARLYQEVPEKNIVPAVALLGIGSNVSQFVSPFIINPVAGAFGGEPIEAVRFLLAAMSLIILSILLIVRGAKGKKITE